MIDLLRPALLTLLAVTFIASGCNRATSVDLREGFNSVETGDTIAQVGVKLAQPMSAPVSHHEALGFKYVEYRFIDPYGSYHLRFAGVPTSDPVLVNKASTSHLP